MYTSTSLSRAQASLLTYSADRQLATHDMAVRAPKGPELAFLLMLDALCEYAIAYKLHQDTLLGEDYYTASEFADIAAALRSLLNTDHGRLDGATVDSAIVRLCLANGVDLEAL